jgi:hypothetical protein
MESSHLATADFFKLRPEQLDALDFDVALVDAVIGHWRETLAGSDQRDVFLTRLGVSRELAETLRLGFSDRSLGLRIPKRDWKAGQMMRGRLEEMGILRSSGHEALRGCLVVPVFSDGTLIALYGQRIDSGRGDVWASGLPGGVFERRVGDGGSTTALVTTSILDALCVVGALDEGGPTLSVIAPARSSGYSAKDLRELKERLSDVVLLGREAVSTAEQFKSLGLHVSLAGEASDLRSTITSAPSPSTALLALLGSAESLSAPTTTAAGEVPTTSQSPVTTDTPGSDEFFVQFAKRSWRVRGARVRANVEGDRLQVALSVSDLATGRFHLDTFDLYAARQRGVFLDVAESELHTLRDRLAVELLEVLGTAERARDDAANETAAAEVMISEPDRAEALRWLEDPNLMANLIEDLTHLGVVGESVNLLACYIATVSRLAERPLGVLVQSSSAGGKSTVVEAISALVPPEDLLSLSALTSQSLYYLGGNGLKHKVLFVAEEQGAQRASYALKLLLSEGRLAIASTGKDRASGQLRTKHYETAGPLALLMTTTATTIDAELENRVVVLGVNEDPAQTLAILRAQRAALTFEGVREREERTRVQRRQVTIQRLLQPLPVLLPEEILERALAGFPATATRHRRDHAKLLGFISAIALLHQFQRERRTVLVAGEPATYLEATASDVEHGVALARQLLARTSEQLAPQTLRLYVAFRECASAQAKVLACDEHEVGITRRELREFLGWSDTQVRNATERLVALEYLVVSPGGRGRCRRYQLVGEFAPVRPLDERTFAPASSGETDQFVQFVPAARESTRGDRINTSYAEIDVTK